ncbi:MAG: NAD-dependent malic enzyme [Vicinamibacteria bacterium]|nr:NAD-dependent malic enzyme [Vicinamibacteria bacterium]
MDTYTIIRDTSGQARLRVPYRGSALLRHPMYNKGTAFTRDERVTFCLAGLLPDAVMTMEHQSRRFYDNVLRKDDPLEKYIGLAALQDRNETLFYRVLIDHLEEFLPIVYTPTVGRACQEFSHIFRRARGLWITPEHRGRVHEVLRNAPFDDVRLIVVTDNERILGLGDQGAGGMGIPVGKLAIYTAVAGIHPAQTLPVSLDVGTDNPELRQDDLYLGCRRSRLRGPEYDDLVDEFVRAVKSRWPKALLQWEDFKKGVAFRLLARYRTLLPSFNDDIQGTAAVTLAGMLAACRITGAPLSRQRAVILGAGAAGVGIAKLLRDTLARRGLQGEALAEACVLVDSRGLLADDREIRDEYKRPFACPAAVAARLGLGSDRPRDLAAVVRAVKPTILVGTSGQPGVFDGSLVRDMASRIERPVIMPLSNPTSKSEAIPADLLEWTGGRALVATGSPFSPVRHAGRTIRIGQGNNAFVFPGVGLGCLVAHATEVTEAMFAAAAECLSQAVTDGDLAAGNLYPDITSLRRVTRSIAEAVVRTARDAGVGRPIDDDQINGAVAEAMWEPCYLPYDPA